MTGNSAAAMPELFDKMRLGVFHATAHYVDNSQKSAFRNPDDLPFVIDSPVGANRAEPGKLVSRGPVSNRGFGFVQPAERSAVLSLVEPIDADGVVKRRATEPGAPCRVSCIGEGAGIDENVPVSLPAQHAQRVGMAVTRPCMSEAAGIGDDVHWCPRQDRDPCPLEQSRTTGGPGIALPLGECLPAHPPGRLDCDVPPFARPLIRSEINTAGGKRRGPKTPAVAVGMKKISAVIVPKEGNNAIAGR